MTVYVDEAIWRYAGRKWCHLLADDTDELHRFAAVLGIHRLSYQGPPKTSAPHYDITGFERDRALRLGARPSSRDEIVAVFRRVRARDFVKPPKPGRAWPARSAGREPRPQAGLPAALEPAHPFAVCGLHMPGRAAICAAIPHTDFGV